MVYACYNGRTERAFLTDEFAVPGAVTMAPLRILGDDPPDDDDDDDSDDVRGDVGGDGDDIDDVCQQPARESP